jgi:hypothetical protein
MSVLAFFPWFTIPAPISVGKFRLVPHRSGASLEAQPRLVDAILAPYQEPGGTPVESATLVHLAGRSLTDELGPAEEASLFRLGDAVAFAALARRGFFEAGPYLNADQLVLVVRRFTGGDPRSIQVVARRRDGRRFVAHGVGAFRFTRPPHAPRPPRFEVDAALASAVLEALVADGGDALRGALAAFQAAGADGDGSSTAQEVLSLATALERVLGCVARELPARLVAALAPHAGAARAPRRLATLRRFEGTVDPGAQPSATIAEAWARDLLRAGRAACGLRAACYWPPEAHLLVGAHLFPQLVLLRLAAAGLRPIAEADRGGLLAFPYLASLRDPFARRRSLAARNPHLWRRALEVAGRQLARIQLAEVLERTGGGPGAAARPPR